MYRYFSIILALVFFASSNLSAQETGEMRLNDSTNIAPKNYAQQYDYEQYRYAFPAKKKDAFVLGLHVGPSMVYGDVRSNLGFGLGLNLQKSLGYVFSARLSTLYSSNTGLDWKPEFVTGDYRNYKTSIVDLNLQGVFTINNIKFHTKQSDIIFNLFAGVGLMNKNTKLDLVGADGNTYDYLTITPASSSDDKGDVLDALNNLLDDDYEAELAGNSEGANLDDNDWNPSLNIGMGLGYRLSDRIALALEHKMGWYGNDYLDGYSIDLNGAASNSSDLLHYTSIGVNINIGKAEEPLFWTNPIYQPYDEVRKLKESFYSGTFLEDEDEDGVANIFDKEENTPPNAIVTTKGVTMDLDKDGVPDNRDKELFTPNGAAVTGNGVALDSDNDGVADVNDEEKFSEKDAQVDAKGRAITGGGSSFGGGSFGPVFFDLNSDKIKLEFYPEIYKLAELLKSDKGSTVELVGHADTRASAEYNFQLALKRAQNIADFLTEQLDVPAAQVKVESKGENNAIDGKNGHAEGLHYISRRVEFVIYR